MRCIQLANGGARAVYHREVWRLGEARSTIGVGERAEFDVSRRVGNMSGTGRAFISPTDLASSTSLDIPMSHLRKHDRCDY